MNDEIKRILDDIDNEECYYIGNQGCEYQDLDKRELKLIKDYITNLQQENKAMQIEMTITWKKVDDLKQRIDKAIETIENYFKEYYISNYDENEIERELLSNLLNILNGKE